MKTMRATELTMLPAHVAFGTSVGRWPVIHDRQEGPQTEARLAHLRARIAEAQSREAAAAARSARPLGVRRSWRTPAIAGAAACVLSAFVIGWILPLLSAHAP